MSVIISRLVLYNVNLICFYYMNRINYGGVGI